MRHILAALFLVGALSGGVSNAAPQAGLYDSVQVSPVTGDEGGVRIRVNAGPSPTVDFALCEGGCLVMHRFPATIEGDRLSFVYVERATDLQGRPGVETRAKVEGRFVPRGLMLKIDFLDVPHDDNAEFFLIPRAKR